MGEPDPTKGILQGQPRTPNEKVRAWAEVDPTKFRFLEIPKEFLGKSRALIVEYFMKKFEDKNKYDFPGLTYYRFLLENPEKVPEVMKDGKYRYLFLGSVISGEVQYICLPKWDGEKLTETTGSINEYLTSQDRILFVSK